MDSVQEGSHALGIEVLLGLRLRAPGRQFDEPTVGELQEKDRGHQTRPGEWRLFRIQRRWPIGLFETENWRVSRRAGDLGHCRIEAREVVER